MVLAFRLVAGDIRVGPSRVVAACGAPGKQTPTLGWAKETREDGVRFGRLWSAATLTLRRGSLRYSVRR